MKITGKLDMSPMDNNNTTNSPFCVLFDLDNTLVGIPNTWIYFDTIIQEVIGRIYKLPVPDQKKRDTLWRSGKDYIEILAGWGVTNPDDFWYQFDQIDGQKRRKLIESGQLRLYDDVIPTLTKLKQMKNVKLGIVTNTPLFIAYEELKAFQLKKYFDEILGLGENQSICKPEPDGILMILEKLNGTPQNSFFIGDSLVDLLAAKRSNVLPILIHRKKKKTDNWK